MLPASQESLASEESQVNYDGLPFINEEEIYSPLFNVNNYLYITTFFKKNYKDIYEKCPIYCTLRICFACSSHLSMHFTALFSVGDRLSYETFLLFILGFSI